MINIDDALERVGAAARPLASVRMSLAHVLGLRLAQPAVSTVDSPPFDKSLVDGFAIAAGDPSPTLRIIELVTAGAVPQQEVVPGTTIRVMTGAPVPSGADAVVKWEDCEQIAEDAIRNPAGGAKAGACVLKQGAAFRNGDVVLPAGKRLSAIDVALLAEIGQPEAMVYPRPRVGVLATGDELVEAHEHAGPGQIRNSNGPMLRAAVTAAGAEAVDLGVARDDPADLRERIARGLACDVLLVSGGVSAGVKDLAPGVFVELGVEQRFHQVRMKPGKPLWFGVLERSGPSATGASPVLHASGSSTPLLTGETPVAHGENLRTLVFGLPGNPVSTFVSSKLFVEPALATLAGAAFGPVPTRRATLGTKFTHRGKRPTYQPCRIVREKASAGRSVIEPLDWKGSADLATLARADCLAVLPEGDYELAAGDEVAVVLL